MQVFEQSREDFELFLKALKQSHELIAPVKTDLVRFTPISDISDIYLEKNAYFPAKEFFFRKKELLFNFDGNEITVPSSSTQSGSKRAFFGLRRCDLNAIKHQDMVFIQDARDPYYTAARENTLLLGYHCNTAPSEACFCGSMELVDFFDIMFFDRTKQDGRFIVQVGSEKGSGIVQKYSTFFRSTTTVITQADKYIPGADRLHKKDISRLYDHPDWKKGVDQCLSCAACTNLCPTCYCFEIHDESSTQDPRKGKRSRSWSSCQVQEFTKVAGNHVFRQKREERFKHRIYHQLEYFKEKYNVSLCVGCGRCIDGCPTRIDFVQIINEMK